MRTHIGLDAANVPDVFVPGDTSSSDGAPDFAFRFFPASLDLDAEQVYPLPRTMPRSINSLI